MPGTAARASRNTRNTLTLRGLLARLKPFGRPTNGAEQPDPAVPPAEPSTIPAPVAVERRQLCLADLSREALRDLITELNARSESVGCVVIDDGGDHDHATIIFAGNLERFHMLAAARQLRGRVIYVQDVVSWWYQGSPLVPELRDFCRGFLRDEVGSRRALLFGQSSGAYAALIASTYLEGSTLVACAPQTFSDAAAKSTIHFVGVRALSAPPDLIDARARLLESVDTGASKNVVIAASEYGNPATAHFWMDYLHVLRIADLPGISLSIVNSDSHVLVHGRVDRFAELLHALTQDLSATVERRSEITRNFLGELFKSA